MAELNAVAYVFLGYVFVLLPLLVLASGGDDGSTEAAAPGSGSANDAEPLAEHAVSEPGVESGAEETTPGSLYGGALVVLGALLALTLLAARDVDYDVFALGELRAWHVALAVGVFALSHGINALTVRWMTPDERRGGLAMLPRTRGEWGLFSVVAVLAGVAEEAAYRGLAVVLLTQLTGSWWVAVALCVLVFAVSHGAQGRKAMVAVGVGTIPLHALVELSGTLVLAMIVHALYDLTAVGWGAWKVKRRGVEALVGEGGSASG